MTKQELIQKHDYKELGNAVFDNDEKIGTIYKKFDNGNMRIIQFINDLFEMREVFLTKGQVNKLWA